MAIEEHFLKFTCMSKPKTEKALKKQGSKFR